ncbi:vesicle transporter GOT1B [Pelomyxa schiedti]|nr:vesicle transporter GOT1B [Pelomyxa schiedti]
MLDDIQKIGVLLTSVGCFFTFLGVILFLDRGLLAIGNVLFLSGVIMVIGPRKTLRFFAQPRKRRGSICFFLGMFLVLMGWVFTGILIEAFGFINLFGDFFPIVLSFLRRLPFIGTFLSFPGIKQLIDKIVSGGCLPV